VYTCDAMGLPSHPGRGRGRGEVGEEESGAARR